jgi:uncharacterized membrane protein
MLIPRWSTIGLFALLVMQFILSWLQAKKTGKSFREAVLPTALIAGAVSIIFVRESFGDLPVWIDAPIAILCCLIILCLASLAVIRFRSFVKEAWRLEDKKDK